MPHQSIKKIFLIFGCTIILLACCACKKREIYTLRSWFNDLALKAGIADYRCQEPYFSVIKESDEDFAAIQSLVEWEVIDPADAINFEAVLTKEYAAHTVALFLDEGKDDPEIIDLADSKYPLDLKKCVQNGVMTAENGKIFPSAALTKEDAAKILHKVFTQANNRHYPKSSHYILADAKTLDQYLIVDDEHVASEEKLFSGDIIKIGKDYKEVIGKDDKGYQITEVDDFTKIFSELKFSGSDPIDFQEAYVEELLPFADNTSIYNDPTIQRMGFSDLSRVVEKNGMRISYSLSLDRLRLYISKKNDQEINAFFSSEVSNICPSYNWNYAWGEIKEAYFKVNFTTTEELGLSRGKYYRLKADFSEFAPEDIIGSLKNIIKEQNDVVESSLTLFKIHVPIQGVPFVELTFDVKINIYLSGKIELVLDSEHQLGIEINNNRLRTIIDNDFSADGSINATASATLGLNFNIEAVGQKLVNLCSDIGVKAKAAATLHLYDDDGRLYSQPVNTDYDLLNDVTADNNDLKICGDLSLNWVFKICLNTSDTLAYKLGLSKEFDILDEDDQIFGNLSHIEDGMFVDKCTRKDRVLLIDPDELPPVKIDAIVLEKYSIILREPSTELKIKGLPNGYTLSDIRYKSEAEEIAVIEDGKIVAKAPGATKIRIYTQDDKYEIYLNVLVSYD